jgi:hypothetical protein
MGLERKVPLSTPPILKVFELNVSMTMGSRKLVFITLFMACYLIPTAVSSVHYLDEWGIYELDPVDGTVSPVFTSPDEIITIRLDPTGEILATRARNCYRVLGALCSVSGYPSDIHSTRWN